MQGNRTSEQQGKICLTHGARASAPTQVLTAQPGPCAHAPRPQPDRLPEQYIPTIGEHVAGPILVPSDADHPWIWRLCLVLTPRRSGGSSSCALRDAPSAPARSAQGAQDPGRRTTEPFTLLPLPATAARPEQGRLARVAAALRAGRGPCLDLVSLPKTALATVLDFGAYAREHCGAAQLEVGHA